MKTPHGLSFKSVATELDHKSIEGQQVTIDEPKGIVECFVAAIGNKDSVGDIILPGAFNGSLKRRLPRVVWGHDWNHPIGKVLEIYEVGPMDPRLPAKMRAAGVGGLFARVQFNLKSEKGREAFANIVFFGMDQEWSIGYKTLDAIFDSKLQANMLKEVELYEVSPVLHGANQLTATINIKSDQNSEDSLIVRGLAMLKTFADENEEFVSELNEKVGIPGAEPNVGRGEIAGGRGPRRGNTEDLLNYWRPIMKKPGGFRRCLVILADHPELGPLPNLCAWLHHETTGKWPNEKSDTPSEEKAMNPASGRIAEMAKALSEMYGKPVRIRESSGSSVLFDEMDDEESKTYSCNFRDDDGEFLFGKRRRMMQKMSWEPEDSEEELEDETEDKKPKCQCGGACGGKSADTDLEVKAGRVLSTANMAKLEQAQTLIGEVLATSSVGMTYKDRVVVKSDDHEVKEALDIVSAYHEAGKIETVDDSFVVSVKSESHLSAIRKVIAAFGAEESI